MPISLSELRCAFWLECPNAADLDEFEQENRFSEFVDYLWREGLVSELTRQNATLR